MMVNTDLTKLIIKIADYIFRGEDNVRKGIGDIMGGKVLELESERLKAEGKGGTVTTLPGYDLIRDFT